MSGRIIKFAEGARVVWFRFAGIWFIVWASLVILYSLVLLVIAFIGPSSERLSSLLEAFGWLAGSLLVSVRLVSVTAQELRDAPKQLAKRRDQFEAWINRERKDV